MNTRLRVSLLLVLLALHSVIGAIETSASKSGAQKLKALDDLYIDDEGDDDIQLQDEASGFGSTHRYNPNLAEGEEEEEEDGDYDYDNNDGGDAEDEYPFTDVEGATEKHMETKVEATTTTSTATTPSRSREEQLIEEEDDELVTPKVSPVAVSPPYSPNEYDDDTIDGSADSGSAHSPTDDEDEDEDEDENHESVEVDEDDYDDEDPIDFSSVAGETDPTDVHVIDDVDEESNPEMVVPTPAPTTEAPPPPYQPDFAAPPQQPETPVVDTPVDGTLPKHNVEENPPHTTDRETHPVDVSGGVAKAGDRQVSFFAQPGILAAVIGGAVVGLLCAILLVMFIVYRMRKKDEGSYALEEPKRNSPNSHPYNNKNSREFYA